MARQKGTAATILLVLLALVILVLALSGQAGRILKAIMDWLSQNAGQPMRRDRNNGKGSGGSGGQTAPSTEPGYQWSQAPGTSKVPYGPPAPAIPQKAPDKTSDPKPSIPTVPQVQNDPTFWAGIVAGLGAIASQIGGVVAEIPPVIP